MSKIIDKDDIDNSKIPNKTKNYANRLKKTTNYELMVTTENHLKEFAPIHIEEKEYLQNRGLKHLHSLFEDKEKNELYNHLFDIGNSLSYYLKDTIRDKIIICNCGFLYKNTFYFI